MAKYVNKELENLLLKKKETDTIVDKLSLKNPDLYKKLWLAFFQTLSERYGKYAPYCSCFDTDIVAFYDNDFYYEIAFKPLSENSFEMGFVPSGSSNRSIRDLFYNAFRPICTVYTNNVNTFVLHYLETAEILSPCNLNNSKMEELCKKSPSDLVSEWMIAVLQKSMSDFDRIMHSIEYSIILQLQDSIEENMSVIKKLEKQK